MRHYAFKTEHVGPITDTDAPIAPGIIYTDKGNYKWYKSSKEIGLLNQKTGQFTDLTTRLLQKSGADIYFFGACLSTDGSFWVAGVNGLIKVTLTEEIFRRYMSVPLEKTGDIGSSVRGITEDNSGMIWACSYGYNRDGLQYLLHQIDPVTHRSRHMQLHSQNRTLKNVVIPYKVLFTKDEVYAVTDGIEFLKIDPETEAYTEVDFPFVSGRGFTSFYKLNDSTFWTGTWGGMGIYRHAARMFQFGSTLAESKGFTFRFETDIQVQNLKLDMQTRKNLYLIFKEAMNNAAKYSNASTVDVFTTRESGHTKLTIHDNGRGFDPDFIRKGNGLANMHHRAAQMNGQLMIHSVIDAGTTITLVF